MAGATRYAIGDLADLGGVSRRTVRYYVQEGLLPPPHGVGRGNHYGPEHLDQLLRVKTLQENGRTLEEIRRVLGGDDEGAASVPVSSGGDAEVSRTLWRRLTIAPGVELHVAGNVRLPSPGKLQELTTWCRHIFREPNGESTSETVRDH
jgi:DNA-binding transcriptional MerR regulator